MSLLRNKFSCGTEAALVMYPSIDFLSYQKGGGPFRKWNIPLSFTLACWGGNAWHSGPVDPPGKLGEALAAHVWYICVSMLGEALFVGSDGWVCFSAWWGCSISFWKPHSDDVILMAFAEGQLPSENPISTREGFKTSSKYDGNNCLWISPRNLGGIFFLLLNFKKRKEIEACVVLGKEEEPPDVLCFLLRCKYYHFQDVWGLGVIA